MPEVILQPSYDSMDQVPEPYRPSYEERDGRAVFSKPIQIDDPAEIKGALGQERKLRQELQGQVGKLTPEQEEQLKKADEVIRREMESQGRYQEIIKTKDEKHRIDLENVRGEAKLYQESLMEEVTLNAATIAINGANVDVEALLPHVLPKLHPFPIEGRPGKFQVFVKDPKNPNQPALNDNGQEKTAADVVAELRQHPVLSKLFPASPASGSGGNGSQFRPGQPRIVRASREEVQDPRQYQKWKDAKAKGEIDGVVLEDGRRLI